MANRTLSPRVFQGERLEKVGEIKFVWKMSSLMELSTLFTFHTPFLYISSVDRLDRIIIFQISQLFISQSFKKMNIAKMHCKQMVRRNFTWVADATGYVAAIDDIAN